MKIKSMDKPHMFEFTQKSLNYTVFDCKWIPCSAKFVCVGMKPNGCGILQIYELNDGNLDKVQEVEKKDGFKCSTFRASSLRNRHLAVGDFSGQLQVFDLEQPATAVYKVKAHDDMINSLDGIGGFQLHCGPPEIVTGSRDGSVKVWDIRQGEQPVINIVSENSDGNLARMNRDCWSVAFGNSYNNQERMVAAGFDNGDLRLFDLRQLRVLWETTLKNGICDIEFDRRDIPMNKMGVTTLEGGLLIFDMRTQHHTKGFGHLEERNAGRSVGSNGVINGPKATLWAVRHLPQNRDIFATCGGTGSLRLWQYDYPDNRSLDAGDGHHVGVMGSITMLYATTISTQPIHCLDWHPDKMGLGVCGSFDQTIRVFLTTNMNLFQ